MQTNFSEAQLQDADIGESNKILRSCVHCGFCTATCPTYQLLGDELDSPRGRIYLIKQMMEQGRAADEQTVKHIDRCLSCLSCMSTCPSGVHYMHLVDHARAWIERTYKRPFGDRMMRRWLAFLLPKPGLFRMSLWAAKLARPFSFLAPGRAKAMFSLLPKSIAKPSRMDRPGVYPAKGARKMRVILMTGCAQRVLAPQINEATIRLLNRLGADIVVVPGAGCCGALTHHMGKTDASHRWAAANIRAWIKDIDDRGTDRIVINASGCGTTVKDYGYMFRHDPELAAAAAKISERTRDVTELVDELGLPADCDAKNMRVTYHAACSLQHGQQIKTLPKELLRSVGFRVSEPKDAHLCCGSAGTYNIMQPVLAEKLKQLKIKNIIGTKPDVIAAGNIGCLTQIGDAAGVPTVHTVELLDWATGGPRPKALAVKK